MSSDQFNGYENPIRDQIFDPIKKTFKAFLIFLFMEPMFPNKNGLKKNKKQTMVNWCEIKNLIAM